MSLTERLESADCLSIEELTERFRKSNYNPELIRNYAQRDIEMVVYALADETKTKRLIPASDLWKSAWEAACRGFSESLQPFEDEKRALAKLKIEIFYSSAPKRAAIVTPIADTLGPLAAVLSFGIIWADDVMFDIRKSAAEWYLKGKIQKT